MCNDSMSQGLKLNVPDTNALISKVRKELKKRLGNENAIVTVGFHEGSHDSISNAELGATLHFGTSKIPARPFLDVGVKTKGVEYTNIIKATLLDGGTLEEALDRVGVVAVAAVQEYMTLLKTPPNAESTIAAKKGKANPLINTGQLRRAVTYKVGEKK